MEIITRQQAINQNFRSYFTGQPCKRGHVAKRYTQSAVCAECLHPIIHSSEIQANRALSEARKLARRRMKKARFRVYNQDFATLKLMVWSFGHLRDPALRPIDIETRVKSTMITPTKYFETFWIYPEDEIHLRKIETGLETKREPVAPLLTISSITEGAAWPEGDPR